MGPLFVATEQFGPWTKSWPEHVAHTHPAPPSSILTCEFLGYDRVDTNSYASALSNSGGFTKAFSSNELNSFGLLSSYERAIQVHSSLYEFYSDEPQADYYF